MSCYIESYLHKMVQDGHLLLLCCVSGREKRFYRFLFLILYVLLAIIGSGSALNSCESATRYSATFLEEKALPLLRYHLGSPQVAE